MKLLFPCFKGLSSWMFLIFFKPKNPRKPIASVCHKKPPQTSFLGVLGQDIPISRGENFYVENYHLAWKGDVFGFLFLKKKNNKNTQNKPKPKTPQHPHATLSVSLIIWKTWPHPVEEKIREISDCIVRGPLTIDISYFSSGDVEQEGEKYGKEGL